MTKKTYSFQFEEEILDPYIARFPEKSRSEVLGELVSNALGVTGIPSEQSSDSPISFDRPTPKRQGGSENESKHRHDTQSVYDYPECPYRTLLKDGYVLCEETNKIPLEACITRQKRYLHFERKCRPVGRKAKPTSRTTRRKKKDDHYCALQGRYVPLDDLPLQACFSCPNQTCKDSMRQY